MLDRDYVDADAEFAWEHPASQQAPVGPDYSLVINKANNTLKLFGEGCLVKTYPAERVERACARAIKYRAYSRKSVATILKNNLDRQDDAEQSQRPLPLHQNVRGARYYH